MYKIFKRKDISEYIKKFIGYLFIFSDSSIQNIDACIFWKFIGGDLEKVEGIPGRILAESHQGWFKRAAS